MSEYVGPKGSQMAILDIPAGSRRAAVRSHVGTPVRTRPATTPPRDRGDLQHRRDERRRHRPVGVRPGGGPLPPRGAGVLMSRASHRRRPITPATTVLLALVAAGITVWLGLVAQLGGVMGPPQQVPSELAVVQVQSGETLQQVARRVAPDAPVAQVVQQIRDFNQLDSAAVDAGQTLIAPVD